MQAGTLTLVQCNNFINIDMEREIEKKEKHLLKLLSKSNLENAREER